MKVPVLRRQFQQLPRGLLVTLGAALGVLIALGTVSYRNLVQQTEAAGWVAHTYQVVSALQEVYAALLGAESGQRAFSNVGREEFLGPYYEAEKTLPGRLDVLGKLVADNPTEQVRLEALRQAIEARLELIRLRISQRRELGAAANDPQLQTGAGLRVMTKVRACVDGMAHEENRLLAERQSTMERARRRTRTLLIAGWLTSFALLAAAFTSLVRQTLRAGRAEDAARKSNLQLKEANNELRAFSYSVAHDLRAPLRSINGFARVIIEDCEDQLNEEGRHALNRITAGANKMGQLIDDLLSLSKISYQPLRSTKIEMGQLARDVCAELIEAEKDRAVDLEIADLPPATGDASLLRQVWINLIGNALKFTRRQPRARIEIGGTSAGPDFVTYFVRDNGAGFDMQYVGKLFGAFQRLHRPSDFEGTGIGLALAQRIVQRHGGTIWAEGKENEGARFAFTLPEWSGIDRTC